MAIKDLNTTRVFRLLYLADREETFISGLHGTFTKVNCKEHPGYSFNLVFSTHT